MSSTFLKAVGLSAAALAMLGVAVVAQDGSPACATLKDATACKARADCIWIPPVMTNIPRGNECRAKPKGPPGTISK